MKGKLYPVFCFCSDLSEHIFHTAHQVAPNWVHTIDSDQAQLFTGLITERILCYGVSCDVKLTPFNHKGNFKSPRKLKQDVQNGMWHCCDRLLEFESSLLVTGNDVTPRIHRPGDMTRGTFRCYCPAHGSK